MFLARRTVQRPQASDEPTTLLVSSVSPRNTDRGTEFHTFFFGDQLF